MKRLLVFVCFVVLAAACTPMSNENTANTNKATETKASAPPSEADIIAKEKGAWDAFKRKDADAFKKTMTTDYIGVAWDGTHDVASSVASIKDAELSDVTFADWKMTTIDKDAVLLTYTATLKGSYKGKPIPEGPYREASAYVNRNGEWLGVYYQETLVKTIPSASPSPAARLQTKAAASPATPMAKAGETTSDAEANEKLVWDSFKTKNYDAFASYLANDFTEVEEEGVYDKAGSIKGVQAIDLTKAELTDWKTVKLDDDASLVTYKVKTPAMKPDTGYHSTIWIKRDSKWVALFHMGTPATEPKATASPEMKPSAESKASPGKKM